jgi:serine/threonine protein kinase
MQQKPPERYTSLRELGRGAIGTVYAARDRSTGAVVALKSLDPALVSAADPNLAEVFLKNARAATRLRHRNIVQVHDAGEAGGAPYVAMELLEGESLRKVLDDGPLSIARAIRIFDDIASALAYAHEEKVVHRGVRPSNITVLPSGVAKIADFGIGQIGEAALRYKSPEQVRGGPVDHQSDIFSLGAVFYEMLTRRAPFEGKSAKEIQEKILRAEAPPPSKVNPLVPAALDEIVSRMLVRQPDQRFGNLRLLLRDLQRLEDGLGLRPAASADEPKPQTLDAAPLREREPPSVMSLPPRARVEPAAPSPATPPEPFYVDEPRFMEREPRREERSGSRAGMVTALVFVLGLVSIGAGALYYSSELSELISLTRRTQEAPRPTVAAPSPSVEPAPVAVAAKDPAPAPAAPAAVPAPPPLPVAKAPEEPAPAPAPKALPSPAMAVAKAEPETPKPVATTQAAKLVIAVSPRGELYIDGKHFGTTPPVTTLDLEPGLHRIEIRSGSRKPYLTYMTVEAGDERRIRHDFNAKPSAPPR